MGLRASVGPRRASPSPTIRREHPWHMPCSTRRSRTGDPREENGEQDEQHEDEQHEHTKASASRAQSAGAGAQGTGRTDQASGRKQVGNVEQAHDRELIDEDVQVATECRRAGRRYGQRQRR
jgi:hypothetical protein